MGSLAPKCDGFGQSRWLDRSSRNGVAPLASEVFASFAEILCELCG